MRTRRTDRIDRRSGEREGFALMLVLIAVVMAVILAISALNSATGSTGIAVSVVDHTQARAIAESGVEATVAYIQQDSDWRTNKVNGVWATDMSLDGGLVTITVEDGVDLDGNGTVDGDGDLSDDSSDPVTITVVASFGNTSHTIRPVFEFEAEESTGYPGVSVLGSKIDLKEDAEIDSYDSTQGYYGGSNKSSEANVHTNATSSDSVKLEEDSTIKGDVFVGVGANPNSVIDGEGSVTGTTDSMSESLAAPTIDVPGNGVVGSNSGDEEPADNTTYSSNQHFDEFKIEKEDKIYIEGDVIIVVEKTFEMKEEAEIRLNPGATLTLYVKDAIKLDKEVKLNDNTEDPSRVILYNVGSGNDIDIKEKTKIHTQIVAPYRKFKLDEEVEFYGSIVVDEIEMGKKSEIHMDTSLSGGGGGGGSSGSYTKRWVE